MGIIECEPVRDVYCEAALIMDHDAALRHAADEFCIPVEAVVQALEAEVAA